DPILLIPRHPPNRNWQSITVAALVTLTGGLAVWAAAHTGVVETAGSGWAWLIGLPVALGTIFGQKEPDNTRLNDERLVRSHLERLGLMIRPALVRPERKPDYSPLSLAMRIRTPLEDFV